jgi:hypothetical protein
MEIPARAAVVSSPATIDLFSTEVLLTPPRDDVALKPSAIQPFAYTELVRIDAHQYRAR